ncbi:MAG TPA: L-seryl-tRNA(Sec) selenium transferase, partial [Verrucomicrobiae bacterium]|nr:L-seryl-tRNA(Sec) selenium transferase [Verrucomicrobiae bacterium]
VDALEVAAGYSNLELDLDSGRRGERAALLSGLLGRLFGCEAALVVNNNAAAVLLVLNTLAADREVVVSRGELVEIGGSFRIPDVMAKSGARLKEIGTTNRTHADDYRRALGPATALLLKVHTSNYRVVGFTAAVELGELVAIGREAGVPVMEDLGSGALVELAEYGLPREPVVRERVAAGADLVTFSGDKLLGGPQAGIVVGRRELVARLAENPLLRAVRPDKLTLAALAATLRLYRESPDLPAALPVLRWLTRPLAELEAVGHAAAPELARRLGPGYRVTLVPSECEVGSGAAPAVPLASRALAVEHAEVSAERIAARFRAARPPVLGRIHDGRFLLDLRGIFEAAELAVDL